MPAPSPSEQRLLWILLGAIFIALNLAAVNYFNGQRRNQKLSLAAAQSQIAEGKIWIERAHELPEKSRELPPLPLYNADDAKTSLMNAISAAASSAGLTAEPNLRPSPQDTAEPAVAAHVKFSGEFGSLVKFLFELQSPEAWRSIEQIDIKADNTPQNVQGDMEVRQYYSETSAGASANPIPEEPVAPEPTPEPAAESAPESESESSAPPTEEE